MREENSWKKIFYSRIFLFGMFFIVVLIGGAYFRAFYQDHEVGAEIKKLQDEARKLETKKLESLEILNYVQSAEFAEIKARAELNLIKPGEHVAIVKDRANDTGHIKDEVVKLYERPNPLKWWDYFMGIKKQE